MNLLNINNIASAISDTLQKENLKHIAECIVVNINVDETTLHNLDKECFNLTHNEKTFQQGDVIQIKFGDINFQINKIKKEES